LVSATKDHYLRRACFHLARRHPAALPVTLFLLLPPRPPPTSTLFPYTTLFRSKGLNWHRTNDIGHIDDAGRVWLEGRLQHVDVRSEEHTSELQSRFDLVCRLLLEKKKDNHMR